jgi:hypothetical protein
MLPGLFASHRAGYTQQKTAQNAKMRRNRQKNKRKRKAAQAMKRTNRRKL